MVLPDDPWKKVWDLLLLCACLLTSLVTPFNVAFYEETPGQGWAIVEASIDALFCADVILCFFAAFLTPTERLVDSRRAIALAYLKSWFAIDLLSAMPSELVGLAGGAGRVLRLVKILKLLRMAKLARKGAVLWGGCSVNS